MAFKNVFFSSNKLKIEELSQIVELQQEVATSELELPALKKMICEKTQALTHATGAVVEMAEGQCMVYRACSGSLEPYLGVKLDLRTSLSGLSVLSGEVLYCEDSETDSRVDRAACRKVNARSMICVPLRHRNKAVGVLKVISPEQHAFSQTDIDLLRLIAGLLSAAVAIRQSEAEALEATKMKSEFLAGISHEIRTPMGGIIGMANLLADTDLDERQKKYLSLINNSAHVLMTLINDLLDFSKIEANKMTFEKVDFDLPVLIDEVVHLLSLSAEKKGLDLKSWLAKDLPRFIQGDPTRIHQIITNLVNNAIKFTERGTVSLHVSLVESSGEKALRFEIKDTGIGISAENLARLFQPFTQADASTTRKFGGTGLGLSICKHLVDGMKGTIGVESLEGHGSTFWFQLPLAMGTPISQKVENKQEIKSSPGEKFRILIAEDNPTNQLIASQLVQKMGHSYKVVSNGKEAIAALEAETFDVVLMDCQMPELDGLQATRWIRQSGRAYQNIPIIALTASAMADDREICYKAGMTGYLTKPIDFKILLETIQLSGQKKAQAA